VADEVFIKVKKMLSASEERRKAILKDRRQSIATPLLKSRTSGKIIEKSPDRRLSPLNSTKGLETPKSDKPPSLNDVFKIGRVVVEGSG